MDTQGHPPMIGIRPKDTGEEVERLAGRGARPLEKIEWLDDTNRQVSSQAIVTIFTRLWLLWRWSKKTVVFNFLVIFYRCTEVG